MLRIDKIALIERALTMEESTKKFYVLRVISGKETATKELLDKEKERAPFSGHIYDVYVPSEKVMVQRGAKKKVIDKPSMPGYVLIQAVLNPELIQSLRMLPNVIGFLGGQRPEPLASYEVERMMRRQDNQAEESVDLVFLVGENVKVVDGAFTGFTATIEEVLSDKKKLKVMVKIFGRKTPLELSYNQVEKE